MAITSLAPRRGGFGGVPDSVGGYSISASSGPTPQQEWAAQQAGNQNRLDVAREGNLGVRLQNQRFNKVFPWVQSQLGSMGQWGSSVGGSQVGSPPTISANPIYSQGMLQRRINSQVANNDQRLAGQQRTMQEGLASRGFGGSSPLAQALAAQMQMGNNAQNQQVRTSLPWETAQGNASHMLQAQMAQEQQFGNRQSEQIERARTAQGFLNPLLGLLGAGL